MTLKGKHAIQEIVTRFERYSGLLETSTLWTLRNLSLVIFEKASILHYAFFALGMSKNIVFIFPCQPKGRISQSLLQSRDGWSLNYHKPYEILWIMLCISYSLCCPSVHRRHHCTHTVYSAVQYTPPSRLFGGFTMNNIFTHLLL